MKGSWHSLNNEYGIITATLNNIIYHNIPNHCSNIEKITQQVNDISTSTENIFRCIKNIKAIATLGKDFENYNLIDRQHSLSKYIIEICEYIDSQFKDHMIQFCYETLYDNNVECNFDIITLRLAIENIIYNSIEAIRSIKKEGHIEIKLLIKSDKWIKITIVDSGTGIPKHLKQRILEGGWSTKSSGGGCGISISKEIILFHKGTLKIHSPKKGTAITMYLPKCKKEIK